MKKEELKDWKVTSLKGKLAPSLYHFQGKYHLILFFNTACIGCSTRAIPFAKQIKRAFPEIEISTVHTDLGTIGKYTIEEVKQYVKKHNIDFPVYLDKNKQTYDTFQAEGTPHWVVLGPKGEVIRSIFGSMPNALQRLYYLLIEQLDNSEQE